MLGTAMHAALNQEVRALFRDRNRKVEDYIRLVREAERLGCNRTRDMLLETIQDFYPLSLDLAAPRRAAAAFEAIDSIIRYVHTRHSLTGNTLPNKSIAGIGMTNPVPRGSSGAIFLPMFMEVAFAYQNTEGYRATVALKQEHPSDFVEYAISYNYPNKRRAPFVFHEGAGPLGSARLAVPQVVLRTFDHFLGRVIAGQDLDDREGPGAFYR